MTPPVAARAPQASSPSLRDRLKDSSAAARPLLYRRRLGRHAGTRRDQSGQRRRACKSAGYEHQEATQLWKPPSGRFRPGQTHRTSSGSNILRNGST